MKQTCPVVPHVLSSPVTCEQQSALAPASSGQALAGSEGRPAVSPVPLVALYCGSRLGHHPHYQQQAILLARQLVNCGFGIVYGGASIGLMGQVADAVLHAGGHVVGVIPDFLLRHEVAHPQLSELYVVDTMHARKALMAERASAFVALPGGLGTFEEILEIATWGQLNQHSKPIILFNVHDYYRHLIAQLDHAVAEGFLSAEHRANVLVCTTVAEVIGVVSMLQSPVPAAITRPCCP